MLRCIYIRRMSVSRQHFLHSGFFSIVLLLQVSIATMCLLKIRGQSVKETLKRLALDCRSLNAQFQHEYS